MNKSKINLENLSLDELKEVRQQVEQLVESHREQNVEQAYQKAIQIAHDVNLSLEELVHYGYHKHKEDRRKNVQAQYINPENPSETWSGRGKQPRWLVAELAKGKTLAEFKVKPQVRDDES